VSRESLPSLGRPNRPRLTRADNSRLIRHTLRSHSVRARARARARSWEMGDERALARVTREEKEFFAYRRERVCVIWSSRVSQHGCDGASIDFGINLGVISRIECRSCARNQRPCGESKRGYRIRGTRPVSRLVFLRIFNARNRLSPQKSS